MISKLLALSLAALALNGASCKDHTKTGQGDPVSKQIIERAVRKEISKPDGPLTQSDYLTLTELNLSGSAVTDLSPLEELLQLQGLNLSGCRHVVDLSPLESLPRLVYLDLTGCTGIKEIRGSLKRKEGLKIIGP